MHVGGREAIVLRGCNTINSSLQTCATDGSGQDLQAESLVVCSALSAYNTGSHSLGGGNLPLVSFLWGSAPGISLTGLNLGQLP